MPAPWKKNFLKIPRDVKTKLSDIESDKIVVAAAKIIHLDEIESGLYSHLQMTIGSTGVELPDSIVPSPEAGKWSRTNVDGREIKRKDLPMISRTFPVESPNFGDASRGYHTNYFTRDVYQVDIIPPRFNKIEMKIIDRSQLDSSRKITVRFSIDEIMNPTDEGFEDSLLYNLNILQENTGVSDIYSSDVSTTEFLATTQVDWEIFPPGERDDDLRKIIGNTAGPQDIRMIQERYNALRRLRPLNFIKGRSGFQRYFGAQFSDDLVAFENIRYGNALYLMYENWQDLSKKSRLQLLAGDGRGFTRIVHTTGWEAQLRYLVQIHRNERLD